MSGSIKFFSSLILFNISLSRFPLPGHFSFQCHCLFLHHADLQPENETSGYIFIHAEGGLNQQRIAVRSIMFIFNIIDRSLISFYSFSLCTNNLVKAFFLPPKHSFGIWWFFDMFVLRTLLRSQINMFNDLKEI